MTEVAQSCTWSQDGYGEDHYDTSCGHRFSLDNGASPLENHMRFCCYCGHPLQERLETEDPDLEQELAEANKYLNQAINDCDTKEKP